MAGRSRRTALGRLLSAVLGLLLSRTGVVETAARRHPAHHLQERKARRRQKHDAAVKRRRR